MISSGGGGVKMAAVFFQVKETTREMALATVSPLNDTVMTMSRPFFFCSFHLHPKVEFRTQHTKDERRSSQLSASAGTFSVSVFRCRLSAIVCNKWLR